MVKLIACDIDGTLIPYGKTDLPDELFPLVRALRKKGILFCPASGRQYHSLRRSFAPVHDEICYLAENGAAIFGIGGDEASAPLLYKSVFPREVALDLCRDVMSCPDTDVFISGVNTTYLCRCGEKVLAHTRNILNNRYEIVDDPHDIPEEIIKVSAYCNNGVALPFQTLALRWESVFRTVVSGPMWIDFTLVDKGDGIVELCKALGISPGEVAAFGDNWNDLSMLRAVGHPYLMSCADPKLKDLIPTQCDDPIPVLKAILETHT